MKKTGWIKRTIIVVLLCIMAFAAFSCAFLYAALNSMYDKSVKIVDRTGEYSVPLQPEDEIIPFEDDTDSDVTTAPDNSGEDTTNGTPSDTTAPDNGNNNGDSTTIPYVEPTYPVRHTNIYRKAPINPDIWNILLLGRDTEGSMSIAGRTDAMIVLSYNKKTGSAKMISLMRDALVPIEGYDWNRLNTPYFFGGSGMAVNTINDVFGLDIQHYIVINFSGMTELIDNFGGVEVTLTQEEADYYQTIGLNLSAGTVTLNGKEAMHHMRNRSVFNSDFSRTNRQRDVLISLYNKIATESDINKTISLINFAMGKVSTNLNVNDLIYLANSVTRAGKQTIGSETMPFAGTYRPAWYRNMLIIQIDILENKRLLHGFIYG